MTMQRVYLYTRYERLWHWLQAGLIGLLLLTGLEVHGSFTIFGFQRAAELHNTLGITWLVAFAFFVFWIITTGEWKQYVPTTRKLAEVARHYTVGIFRGEPHPVPKRTDAKHNPLQRLAYLGIAAVLLPLQMATGMAYWLYNDWAALGLGWLGLEAVALLHVAGAFAVLAFLIGHVYMTTTGHTVFAHLWGMITGWEEVEDAADWEARQRG